MPTRVRRLLVSLVIAVVIPLAAIPLAAQHITIVAVDSTAFPNIRAQLIITDATGQPLTGLSTSDITVTEGGSARSVQTFRCPGSPSVEALSSVLTIDVSGSMAQGTGSRGGAPNVELARAAARAWIDALPAGSQCALTSFDDRSLINTDFTTDRARLADAIVTLKPSGGTNYNSGFTDPSAGALAIAESGRYKRVVVFLTDGLGDCSENSVVTAAQKENATIFCVTLGMRAPASLKNIARRTGGACYENVTTIEEARGIYQAILYQALGGEPCELVWKSEADCSLERTATIAVPSQSLSTTVHYKLDRSALPAIVLDPPALAFGVVEPGRTRELRVTLAAANRPVTIERIERVGRGGSFTLDGPAGPFTLAAGERKTMTVRYTAADTDYAFARWAIRGDACSGASIAASAGSGATKTPTIRLIAPNGGERFIAGAPVTLSWDGVLPTDPVRLEYSTDAGSSWRTVVDSTSGTSFAWHAPATPSERCLARVAQIDTRAQQASTAIKLTGHTDYVMSTTFSPDGRHAVTASWDGTARIWNARTGALERTLAVSGPDPNGGRLARVYYAEFTPDGRSVLTASDGQSLAMWDAASGRQLRKMKGALLTKPSVEGARMDGDITPDAVISADGSRLVARTLLKAGIDHNEYEMALFDVPSGRRINALTGHTDWVRTATFSPDGKLIVTGSDDSTARIWDAATGRQLTQFTGHRGEVRSTAFSADNRLVASTADDGYIHVWEAQTGHEVQAFFIDGHNGDVLRDTSERSFRGTPKRLRDLRAIFSPDGANLLVWGGVEIPPLVIDLTSGKLVRRVQEHESDARSSVGFMVYSPDGAHIGSREAAIEVWDANSGALAGSFEWDMQMSWLAFSPDGSRIAGSKQKDAMLWRVDAPITQSDPSDSLWAIIDARPVAVDVDFGDRPLRVKTDSVVTAFIGNNGASPMHVESVAIGGTNAKEFSVVSGMPPFDLAPGESHAMEFRFAPASAGARTAVAEIDAGGRKLRQTLRGNGVALPLRLATEDIDFGGVPVGEHRDSTVTAIIRNGGRSPVELTRTSIAGPDTGHFAITSGGEAGTLAPGASRAVTLRFAPSRTGRTSARLVFQTADSDPITADLFGRGLGDDAEPSGPEIVYRDPTTFRTIAAPNAIVPKRGSIVAGTYDVVGLMAGWVPIDRVMILAGGAPPLPDDWGGVHGTMYGAFSLGAKIAIIDDGKLRAAAGYQWARSIYDRDETPDSLESGIVAHTPYASVSWGDDDSRISLTGGYAFKTHTAIGVGSFTKNAAIISLGGDYRFANRWKVAVEALYMQTIGYIPVAATARFFGETWALDAGLGFLGIPSGDGDAASLPVAPVLSFVKVW